MNTSSFLKIQIKRHFFTKTSKLFLSKATLRNFDALYCHLKEFTADLNLLKLIYMCVFLPFLSSIEL